MERRVSSFPESSGDLEQFQDCPFLGSKYVPVKDVSKNFVVRTYFAVSKAGEELVIKCIERGRTCSPACLSELQIHHMSYGHPFIAGALIGASFGCCDLRRLCHSLFGICS